MTKTKKITSFRVSWTADHEQYYQGRSIMFSDYTHSGQGCGETLRDAFENALDNLMDQGLCFKPNDLAWTDAGLIGEMLAELTGQVKEPDMIDWDIVRAKCPEQGEHRITCPTCDGHGTVDEDGTVCTICGGDEDVRDLDPDCAVCAGDWHFYVNVDVRLEDGE